MENGDWKLVKAGALRHFPISIFQFSISNLPRGPRLLPSFRICLPLPDRVQSLPRADHAARLFPQHEALYSRSRPSLRENVHRLSAADDGASLGRFQKAVRVDSPAPPGALRNEAA